MRIAPGVTRFVVPPLVVAVPAFFVSPTLGTAFLALAAFVVWFHRDPDREPPTASGAVSPADGKVSVVREEPDGRWRVGVYMNVIDVHVNRAPFSGTVESVEHRPGGHTFAFDKEKSEATFTVEEFLDRLRALTFPPHDNAYVEIDGERYYVEIDIERA